MLWKWFNVSSIAMFSRKAMSAFTEANKDVMYDLLKREDVNWREFNLQASKEVYRVNQLHSHRLKAFVLDDSIKSRRGKKMEGVSSHFDHVTNRHVMGQQVLTLGMATEESFLPIDSQVYVSQTKAKGLVRPFKDGRSIVAKRYQEATEQSKPVMAANMMKRAQRDGLNADYLVADAWFGTKPMIRTALDLGVCPILRMKKNNMKYRSVIKGRKKELLDAKELYAQAIKGEWKRVRGLPWKSVALEVELDLSEGKHGRCQVSCRTRLLRLCYFMLPPYSHSEGSEKLIPQDSSYGFYQTNVVDFFRALPGRVDDALRGSLYLLPDVADQVLQT
jgi:hypothetical protein